MLRLSPSGFKRMAQADCFEAVYGGAEANVAENIAGAVYKACKIAKEKEITISCDLNYRSKHLREYTKPCHRG